MSLFSLFRSFVFLVSLPFAVSALEMKLDPNPPSNLVELFRIYNGEGLTNEMQHGFKPVTWKHTRSPVLRLSGTVEKGDDQRLWNFVLQAGKEGHYGLTIVVDDMPGGNFAEAMKIGLRIHGAMRDASDSWVWGVLVPKGARCESACAVIGAFAGDRFYIQPGATVGFHLPFLSKETVEALNRARIDVESVMATTYDISLAYSEMGLRRMASAWLIREAYKHRTPDSFFYLRTAEDIHRAGFTPVGPRSVARPITVQNMRLSALGRICNAEMDRSRQDKTQDDIMMGDFVLRDVDRFGSLPSIMKQVKRRWFRIEGFDMAASSFVCVFGLDSSERLHVRVTKSPPPCVATYKQLPRLCAVKQPRWVSFVSKHAYDRGGKR